MPNTREKLIEIVKQKEAWLPNVGTSGGQTLRFVDHLITNGVTVQQWIPVTERLPKNREDVLVVAFWHEKWNVLMGWYAPDGNVWHVGLLEETGYPISHWMPLPEPPKEVSTDA